MHIGKYSNFRDSRKLHTCVIKVWFYNDFEQFVGKTFVFANKAIKCGRFSRFCIP